MADFTPAGAAQKTRFADRVGREIIVQHEALAIFAFEHIHDLFVLAGAEGRDHQRLGLAAGKERRAMAARQNADLAHDLAHIPRAAPVDTFAGF